jgi:hypothetical protein
MTKTEDLPQYIIGRNKITFVGEYRPSDEELLATRAAAFSELRKTAIPSELIDLVEQFNEQEAVRLGLQVTQEKTLKPVVKRKAKRKNALTAGEALVSVRNHIESYESFVIQEWCGGLIRGGANVDGEESRALRPQQIAISE